MWICGAFGFGAELVVLAASGVADPFGERGGLVVVGERRLDQCLAVLPGGIAGGLGLMGAADRVRPG